MIPTGALAAHLVGGAWLKTLTSFSWEKCQGDRVKVSSSQG
jgi:hypothetical protein